MPYEPPPYLAELSLSEIAEQVAQRKLPPVENWAPQKQGDSFMQILPDGTWLHEGDPIRREAMVRAFAGLMTRDEAGQHWLVTPFEKLTIAVDDAPFVAVDCAVKDGDIAFRLNTDELVLAGPEHPIHAAGDADTPAIYVHVRRGCDARLNRSTWAQLVDIALDQSDGTSVTSGTENYSLIPAQTGL
jgi:hypothetical protein